MYIKSGFPLYSHIWWDLPIFCGCSIQAQIKKSACPLEVNSELTQYYPKRDVPFMLTFAWYRKVYGCYFFNFLVDGFYLHFVGCCHITILLSSSVSHTKSGIVYTIFVSLKWLNVPYILIKIGTIKYIL